MSQPGRSSRGGTWFLLLLAVGGGVGGWYYWQGQKAREAAEKAAAAAPKPAVPVTVMRVKPGRFDVQLEGLGTVQPVNTVVVRSRVDGQIEGVFFKEGQFVREGDLLLRIDARPFKAAVDQAQAKLLQDQATLTNARSDLARQTTLEQQQIASRQKLEAQQAAVAAGAALLQADQAALDNARVQLSYTEIKAPLTGRIGFRQVDTGNIVRAGDTQPLLSIVQTDPINVLYTLPEGDLATVQQALAKGPLSVVATVVGQRVTPVVTGTVSVVNNQVDQASGTVQIKAVFPNRDLRLWPGQSVTTRTRVETLEGAVVVPVALVQHGPNGLYVWRVDENNQAQPAPVKVRDQDSANAVVAQGLSIGDQIVVSGQLRLRKGIKVDPRDGGPDQQARAAGGTTQ